MTPPLMLDADAVRAACRPVDAVDAVTAALVSGLDPAGDLPRQAVPLRSGQFLLMPSEGAGWGAHVGVKVATVAPGNPARGLPRIQASYLLFDAGTLALRAVLDGTALTTLRTPAVSVAAVRPRLLASAGDGPLRVAVLGGGPQAHAHVATLRETLAPYRAVGSAAYLVRDPGRVSPPGPATVHALGTAQADESLRTADVVVCATSARSPLFDADLIGDTVVVVAVGSHEPDAREVPAALCSRATVVVEDVRTALREAGDVCLAVDEGELQETDLVPMRDVVAGTVVPDPARPLLFKSVGMAWQDLVVAVTVLSRTA